MINGWIVICSWNESGFLLGQCLSTVLKEKAYHFHTLHLYLENKLVGTDADKKKYLYVSQLKAT